MAEEEWSPWTDQIYQDNRSTLKKNLSPLDMRCELRARSCLADHQLDELEAILKARGKGVHNHTMLQFLELGSLDSFEVFCVAILKVEPKFNFEEVLRRFAPLRAHIKEILGPKLVKEEEGGIAFTYLLSDETGDLKFKTNRTTALCYGWSSLEESPKAIEQTLVKKLGVSQGNVHVLPPNTTADKMTTMLEAQAKADIDLLVVSFAGHGQKENGLQFDGSVFTSEMFCKSLSKCKNTMNVLLLLDSCYSGDMAERVKKSLGGRCKLWIMHACSAFEATWSVGYMNCTMFTYFVTSYLNSLEAVGESLPIRQTMEHARAVCPALANLIKTDQQPGTSTVPTPGLVSPQDQQNHVLGDHGGEQLQPITAALLDSLIKNGNCVPEALKKWFDDIAKTSVQVLSDYGYMKQGSKVLMGAVLSLGDSAVWFLKDAAKQGPLKPDVELYRQILRIIVVLLEDTAQCQLNIKMLRVFLSGTVKNMPDWKSVTDSVEKEIVDALKK